MISCSVTSYGQSDKFRPIYPIGDNPNIGYKNSMVPSIEKILFEANPVLRMPIYNNIQKHLENGSPSGSTFFFNFRPQFRMYIDNSLPVKMPSYKIGIVSYQYIRRLKEWHGIKNHLLAFSFESGHYSNGQAGCAFSNNADDGSKACDSVYNLITPNTNLTNILNRKSGNFSTNYTELIANYRMITCLDENNKPTSAISLKAGINRYHNNLLFIADIGGFSDNDIKIYGKNRYIGGIEYFLTANKNSGFIRKLCIDRFSNSVNLEYIDTPHPFVNPWRIELTSSVYLKNNLGIFISGIYGHDNYNYRFVDSGTQFFAGITFDSFPPIEIK